MISGNGTFFMFQEKTFQSLGNFREIEVSNLTLKKLYFISGGKLQRLKIKQKTLLKVKVDSYDVFSVFTVEHREIRLLKHITFLFSKV